MSKKKRRQKAPAPRRQQEPQNSGSLVIPVLVGLVLVVVVVGVIASFENRGARAGTASIPTTTALSTTSIPYPDVPRTSIQETQQRVAAGEAIMVDVRSAAAYQQSHVTGAISLPETEVKARLEELPRNVELILYCT